MTRDYRYWLPVVAWMAVIYLMSTNTFSGSETSRIIEPILRFLFPGLPQERIVELHLFIRKCGHAVEYFILGLLLFRYFRAGSPERRGFKWSACAMAVVVVYASLDEFHQSFVATRTASPVDVAIDSMGGVFSQILVGIRRRYFYGLGRPG